MAARGTEVATRLRPTGAAGRHGERAADVELRIEHCHFLPRTSSESADPAANTVVVGMTLVAPGGTDLLATDRVRRELDGKVYEIEGEPGDYRKGGRSKAVIAALVRVEG